MKLSHNYYVYITMNPSRTVLYTGVTNDLQRRISEHMANRGNEATFAGKFYCYNLVYYEYFQNIDQAISREKDIKNMSREDKLQMVKETNPRLGKIIL